MGYVCGDVHVMPCIRCKTSLKSRVIVRVHRLDGKCRRTVKVDRTTLEHVTMELREEMELKKKSPIRMKR